MEITHKNMDSISGLQNSLSNTRKTCTILNEMSKYSVTWGGKEKKKAQNPIKAKTEYTERVHSWRSVLIGLSCSNHLHQVLC